MAQDSLRVTVIGNVKQNMIQLRWGVNTPLAWKQCNRYGFVLERYTVVRDGQMLAAPEKVVMSPNPVKPPELDQWKDIATSNNYAALIAQALYGKEFSLDGNNSKGVSGLIALAQELEQRYVVSMYAADLNFAAAQFAGWGFEDKTVKHNERYLYRVKSAVPKNILYIAEGSAYLALADHKPLEPPPEFNAIFGNKSVMLTWNYGLMRQVYHAYHIEKSSDGKSFRRLSEVPFMNMNTQGGKPADRMYYADSLSDNNVKTYYRIVGVTSFGEEGPASQVVEGQGKEQLVYVPHIHRAVPEGNGVVIDWEFDARGNNAVKEFQLQWSASDRGPFKTVVRSIQPSGRSIRYDDLRPSNYFVIAAIPFTGEPSFSFPVLVQPSDTIPPAIPQGLAGYADSLGVVRLVWKGNDEKDLLGYRVYRAQTDREELIPLNDVAVRKNEFIDTIDVKNLNRKVYYAVTAVDHRYNQSRQSEAVAITKPDLVPPTAPLISDYSIGKRGISLHWVIGDSTAVSSVRVFRQDDSQDMKLLTTLPASQRHFTDTTVVAGRLYAYSMTALTSSGLASPYSPVVKAKALMSGGSTGVLSGLPAKYDRKEKGVVVQWTCSIDGVTQFEIYRAAGGQNPSLWKVLKGYERRLVDSGAEQRLGYVYIIRAILENGKTGGTVKITVPQSAR